MIELKPWAINFRSTKRQVSAGLASARSRVLGRACAPTGSRDIRALSPAALSTPAARCLCTISPGARRSRPGPRRGRPELRGNLNIRDSPQSRFGRDGGNRNSRAITRRCCPGSGGCPGFALAPGASVHTPSLREAWQAGKAEGFRASLLACSRSHAKPSRTRRPSSSGFSSLGNRPRPGYGRAGVRGRLSGDVLVSRGFS
jgi:hypothetical protein